MLNPSHLMTAQAVISMWLHFYLLILLLSTPQPRIFHTDHIDCFLIFFWAHLSLCDSISHPHRLSTTWFYFHFLSTLVLSFCHFSKLCGSYYFFNSYAIWFLLHSSPSAKFSHPLDFYLFSGIYIANRCASFWRLKGGEREMASGWQPLQALSGWQHRESGYSLGPGGPETWPCQAP